MGSDPAIEYCDSLFLDAYDSGRDRVLWRDEVEVEFRGAGPESIASDKGEARSAGDAAAEGEFMDIVAVAVIPPQASLSRGYMEANMYVCAYDACQDGSAPVGRLSSAPRLGSWISQLQQPPARRVSRSLVQRNAQSEAGDGWSSVVWSFVRLSARASGLLCGRRQSEVRSAERSALRRWEALETLI